MTIHLEIFKNQFDLFCADFYKKLATNETLTITLNAEESQFIRFNQAKVRQSGTVLQGVCSCRLNLAKKSIVFELPYTGQIEIDGIRAQEILTQARTMAGRVADDPFQVEIENNGRSHHLTQGALLTPNEIPDAILRPAAGLDYVGLYAGGQTICASSNSLGQDHFFATEHFVLDYSVFAKSGKAIKTNLAGQNWDQAILDAKLRETRERLTVLEQPEKVLLPGQYRVYMTPEAFAAFVEQTFYHVGEGALQRKESALIGMREKGSTLSPQFTLTEDFTTGLVPCFNGNGEISPETITVIERGALRHALVSRRTAKQYSVTSNGAETWEGMRSPAIAPGMLLEAKALEALNEGVFITNLHYLNFSDIPAGRITGMTRYACVWVENGKVVAPIRDMRFDDTIYQVLGKNLEALTRETYTLAETGTYEKRSLGAIVAPGALIRDFSFTL